MKALTKVNFHNKARFADLEVAVLLPCYNESETVVTVVGEFSRALPNAHIYVYDNNSTDDSWVLAEGAGATVRSEARQGKGFVVRRMFADIEADIFVMCDADGTYDASVAPKLIELLIKDGLDMVVGARAQASGAAYPLAHKFGNWFLTSMVSTIFGTGFKDMLSGYRVMSNRFVKSFPQMSQGFEIETELTIHALQLQLPSAESPTHYCERPRGSTSKLRTIPDGCRILTKILVMLKQERPLYLFSFVFFLLFFAALATGAPVIAEFVETGIVPRLPSAVLATGLMVLAFLCLFCGLILDTVTRGRNEAKRLRYLQLPSVHTVSRLRAKASEYC
ncbi:glycosyltransferase family 2 protein [Marinobacter alexandrii]|uniref:glycosyltransferase family 2 protein n=1 Tax=Marinobacter alexandrii TaxID=2570351 RepID=UPI0032969DC6